MTHTHTHTHTLPRQHGNTSADLHTTSRASTLKNIRTIYSKRVAQELLHLTVDKLVDGDGRCVEAGADGEASDGAMGSVKMNGYVSNANWSQKNGIFILFINNRCVLIKH